MAVNIPLLILLRPLTSAIAKIVLGTTVAALTYAFLNNTVLPLIDRIQDAILSQVSSLSTMGGAVGQVVVYFDIPHMISILFSCSAACMSIRLMAIAIRAFGVNTG